jgi:hypothetical protein
VEILRIILVAGVCPMFEIRVNLDHKKLWD